MVTVVPACVLEFLLAKIASDAQLGGMNIRKPSFTNAEHACAFSRLAMLQAGG
jgi:hypothetical protein